MIQVLKLQDPTKRLVLYDVAKACLGKDMAPLENEYGCAEALNEVYKKAFGSPIGGGLSSYLLYHALKKGNFLKVLEPLEGDIIISPTGFGNGNVKSGHVGIVSTNDKIMSNTSRNGLWEENYTLKGWKERFEIQGGYPVFFFRVI